MASLRMNYAALLGAMVLGSACGDSAVPGQGNIWSPPGSNTGASTIPVGSKVDLNGDGVADGTAVDSNGDGIADMVDTNGDGMGDEALPANAVVIPSTTTPGGDGGSVPSTGDGGVPSTGTGGGLPCNVQQIVQEKCSLCHGSTPSYSAPMSLVTLADFHANAPGTSTPVYQLANTRINASDPSRRMPPVPQPTLTADELTTFTAWLNQGAPASTESCTPGSGSSDAGTGNHTGDSDSGTGINTGGGLDCPDGNCNIDTTGLDCYKFTAHAQGDKNTKYTVAPGEKYWNFSFQPPWTGDGYGVVFKPIIDNHQVIHHWLLFNQGTAVQDGAVGSSTGTHPNGDLVAGWAPGGDAADYRTYGDVGIGFNPGGGFVMEIHYNNNTGASAQDASGVEVCVMKNKPTNVAGISWLGTDAILGTTASGNCAPANQTAPIQILSISPHMHLTGKHMKSVINRVGGTTEVLHDADFDFNNQTWYPAQTKIMPGDTIDVTCTFSSFSTFGTSTTSEMCYMFTVAYPKGALSNGAGSSLHGGGSCLGAF